MVGASARHRRARTVSTRLQITRRDDHGTPTQTPRTFAREGDDALGCAVGAADAGEAVGQDPAPCRER